MPAPPSARTDMGVCRVCVGVGANNQKSLVDEIFDTRLSASMRNGNGFFHHLLATLPTAQPAPSKKKLTSREGRTNLSTT